MEREPSAGSSNIASVGYDDATGTMEVEFRNGAVYQYTCPRSVFEGFKASGFRGRYFHTTIKPAFEGRRQSSTKGING